LAAVAVLESRSAGGGGRASSKHHQQLLFHPSSAFLCSFVYLSNKLQELNTSIMARCLPCCHVTLFLYSRQPNNHIIYDSEHHHQAGGLPGDYIFKNRTGHPGALREREMWKGYPPAQSTMRFGGVS